MKFKAKLDWWIHGLLLAEAVFAVYFIVMTVIKWSWVNAICALVLISVFIIFTLPIYRHTYYLIDGNSLTISSGYYKRSMGIQHITSIESVIGKLNATVLSNHQLELTSRIGSSKRSHTECIAPKNRKAFIDALLAVNPNIYVKKEWSDEDE